MQQTINIINLYFLSVLVLFCMYGLKIHIS